MPRCSDQVERAAAFDGEFVVIRLPRYVRAVRSRATGLHAFYFEIPTWARRQGCPVVSCPLGNDINEAMEQGELKSAELREWMDGRQSIQMASGTLPGSLGALVERYRRHRNFSDLKEGTRANYEQDLRALTTYEPRSGKWAGIPLGLLPWQAVTQQVVDTLIDDMLVKIVDVDGQPRPVLRPRRTRSIVATAATMWRVAAIAAGIQISTNPFLGHRIKRATQETVAASADQVCDVIVRADDLGNSMLGTIVLCIYELVWRPEHVVRDFRVEHYRPPDNPGSILITDAKNGELRWRPLFDQDGQPQYPALMARLDALKGSRTKGAMFSRDGNAEGDPPSMVTVRTWLRAVVETTPHDHLTLATFRHGALTECGEAGLTTFEIRRLSLHRTTAILERYVHGTPDGQEMSQAKRIGLRKGRRASTRGSQFLAGGPGRIERGATAVRSSVEDGGPKA